MIADLNAEQLYWEHMDGQRWPYWKVAMTLHLDPKTWERSFENLGTVAKHYELDWDYQSQKPAWEYDNSGSMIDAVRKYKKLDSKGRIFTTTYDPESLKAVDKSKYVHAPKRDIQFFGTRVGCLQRNPNAEPIEVGEPLYLNDKGAFIWPNPDTGIQNLKTHSPVKGFRDKPMDFSVLQIPKER